MHRTPAGQHRVEMPDGLVFERLPLGYANGRWRLAFVVSGFVWPDDRGGDLFREMHERVGVSGVGGLLEKVAGSGGGSDNDYEMSMTLVADDDVTGIQIGYFNDGRVVETEEIAFPGR